MPAIKILSSARATIPRGVFISRPLGGLGKVSQTCFFLRVSLNTWFYIRETTSLAATTSATDPGPAVFSPYATPQLRGQTSGVLPPMAVGSHSPPTPNQK